MATSEGDVLEVLKRVCDTRLSGVKLKLEQKQAVTALLERKDVFAVLPTGFGKSLIYQSYILAKAEASPSMQPTVIVVVPLRSIAQEQVKVSEFGLSAVLLSLDAETLEAVRTCKVQVVYASAENLLSTKFLEVMKEDNLFMKNLALIAVDESHTVYTWGKETKRGKKMMKPFRDCYGSLATLRSFCCGVLMIALTGTADSNMSHIIKNQLALPKDCLTISVSPERENIKHTVIQTSRFSHLDHFNWLVELIKEKNYETPKTIIFCNSLQDVAQMVSYLFRKFECSIYVHDQPHIPANRLVGIYHSHTFQIYKDKFDKGNIRVVIATSALSMGVNFPDVKYVVHFGPPRALVDHIQEAGRAGRNGKRSHDITIYHGNQLSHCEGRVKEFVKAKDCLRVKIYGPFHRETKELEPLHHCCSNCAHKCKCESSDCKDGLPFSKPCGNVEEKLPALERAVSTDNRETFKDALLDMRKQFDCGQKSVFDSVSTHGFSDELINSLVDNCHHIFSVDDLMNNYPIYSLSHAFAVLEVLHELFEDVPAATDPEIIELMKCYNTIQ